MLLAALAGLALILIILRDAFETIVLPRRITHRLRFTRFFYAITWGPWSAGTRLFRSGGARESYLSIYGPLSLILLLAFWAAGLLLGFALLQWSLSSPFNVSGGARSGFPIDLYVSGTTFFTLGLGDVTPITPMARLLTVLEAGLGFGFLAVVIGYLPVLYQAFSERETNVSLLDARAGSPPTAGEFLRRHGESGKAAAVGDFLRDWERWSAELMESHLSYPVLAYFRSQHDNQSWVSGLTTILDICALVMVGVDGVSAWSARLTFAMARHAAVDLAQIFNTAPRPPAADRLPPADLAQLRALLAAAGLPLSADPGADAHLAKLRGMYEPYVNALAGYLQIALPSWLPAPDATDNWRSTAWGRTRDELL